MHFISIGSENEDSDQEREWEEQQIKKGVSLGSEVRSNGIQSYEV